MATELFRDEGLCLELRHEADAVRVVWSGKSVAREPGKLILRVMTAAMAEATEGHKPLCIDFCDVAYMSSSTITPIVRVLDRAKRSDVTVRLTYKRALRWQELSFSALTVFQTADNRIEVTGV